MACCYCLNAFVDDELDFDCDLSYHGISLVDNTFRVFFRSGDARKTGFVFERHTDIWHTIGHFYPSFCPFCGRELFENRLIKTDI